MLDVLAFAAAKGERTKTQTKEAAQCSRLCGCKGIRARARLIRPVRIVMHEFLLALLTRGVAVVA